MLTGLLLLLTLSGAASDITFLGQVEQKLEARRRAACAQVVGEKAVSCALPYDRAIRHVALLKLVLGPELAAARRGELTDVERFTIGAALESFRETEFPQFAALVKPVLNATEWTRLVKIMELARDEQRVEMRGCCTEPAAVPQAVGR
ncbi:MAG: hypothetical protein AB2A00_35650 [Myxococcota bacterium]